uniref:Uncharacterized protein n=1 Tax=Panagrolaimus sp. JU765 TaxID=591449 RepID=A0AC34RCP0_9BILA
MDKKDRRSSILRTIDENQPRNTNRIPRRVSFQKFRIVKEFDSALEAIDRTPQLEPMQLSTDVSSLELKVETTENIVCPENVLGTNKTFIESKDNTTNFKADETAIILNKLDSDFVALSEEAKREIIRSKLLRSVSEAIRYEKLRKSQSGCDGKFKKCTSALPFKTTSPGLLNDTNAVFESMSEKKSPLRKYSPMKFPWNSSNAQCYSPMKFPWNSSNIQHYSPMKFPSISSNVQYLPAEKSAFTKRAEELPASSEEAKREIIWPRFLRYVEKAMR